MIRTAKTIAVLGLLALCGTVWGVEPIPNLISHWTFDEGEGDIAYDSFGDNDGTIYGATWTTGQIGGALSFDGNGDYVKVPHNSNLNLVSEGTVAAWVNLKGSYRQAIVTKQPDTYGVGNYFLFTSTGGNMGFGLTNGVWAQAIWVSTSAITNEWAFYVGTFNSSTVSLYENGVLVHSKPTTITPIATNQPLYIGRWPFSSNWDCNGSIDEVMIFNICLSAEEVWQLYQDGLGEVVGLEIVGPNEVAEDFSASYKAIAYYDSNSTKDVTDSAEWLVEPNSFASIEAGLLTTEEIYVPQEDITIYAQYTEDEVSVEAEKEVLIFAICPSGSALSFDGVNDYVNVPDSDSLDMSSSKNMTMGAWIILKSTGNNQLFAKSDGSDPKYEILIGSQRLGWWIDDGPNYKADTDDADTISLNEWHYVAIVFDRTNNHIIRYLDGQQTGTIDNFGSVGDLSNSKPFTIGVRADLVSCFFDGTIDDVRIYDRALSAEEIWASMHTRPTGDEPGLVGYWDFDKGEGQVAYDLSPYGNNGYLGSDPCEPDESDPAWIESDAPMGICTLEELVERNLSDVLDIKLDILEQLGIALAKEEAVVDMLNTFFKNRDFGSAKKKDVVKAKQKIHSAMQHEEQAEAAVDNSIERLEDALTALGLEP